MACTCRQWSVWKQLLLSSTRGSSIDKVTHTTVGLIVQKGAFGFKNFRNPNMRNFVVRLNEGGGGTYSKFVQKDATHFERWYPPDEKLTSFAKPVMEQTATLVGVPPGLEYLTQIDQILIHQKKELLEVLCGFETNNQYEIKNIMGQTIYKALEDTNCCIRNMCGPLRRFNLMIKDNMDQEVMHLVRPWRCGSCCFPCCLQELEVQSPPGTALGYVVQDWHPILPKFSILGPSRETVLKLDGPCLLFNCCGDIKFELKGKEGQEVVGRITKQWGGLLKEILTDADNFGIQFPMDLDVRMKAVLVGACFLIDFMYFETAGDGDNLCSCLFS